MGEVSDAYARGRAEGRRLKESSALDWAMSAVRVSLRKAREDGESEMHAFWTGVHDEMEDGR